jgi:pyrimidine-nucleoside phosphorylase
MKEKEALTRQEIDFFIDGVTNKSIPDCWISAWAMAVLLNRMTNKETTDLTVVIAASGEILDFHDFG